MRIVPITRTLTAFSRLSDHSTARCVRARGPQRAARRPLAPPSVKRPFYRYILPYFTLHLETGTVGGVVAVFFLLERVSRARDAQLPLERVRTLGEQHQHTLGRLFLPSEPGSHQAEHHGRLAHHLHHLTSFFVPAASRGKLCTGPVCGGGDVVTERVRVLAGVARSRGRAAGTLAGRCS